MYIIRRGWCRGTNVLRVWNRNYWHILGYYVQKYHLILLIVRCTRWSLCLLKILSQTILYQDYLLWGSRYRKEANISCILSKKMIKVKFLLSGHKIRCYRKVSGNKFWIFIDKGWIVLNHRMIIILIILDLVNLLS